MALQKVVLPAPAGPMTKTPNFDMVLVLFVGGRGKALGVWFGRFSVVGDGTWGSAEL